MDSQFNEEALLAWCELHGAVRRFERRENGDIHVYWKEWEVADTVSLLPLSVVIRNNYGQHCSSRSAYFIVVFL